MASQGGEHALQPLCEGDGLWWRTGAWETVGMELFLGSGQSARDSSDLPSLQAATLISGTEEPMNPMSSVEQEEEKLDLATARR